jgi:hypothetical protein
MTNIFQHAIGLATFAYAMTLLVSYMILMACALAACNLLSTVLSDKMVHVVKRVVSSCANGLIKYLALQPSCEYLNESQDNMRHYKNKKIKSVQLYYRRVPKKLLNLYHKITLGRMDSLNSEIMTEYTKMEQCAIAVPVVEYLRQNADLLPFHCGLVFEMEDGAHLMLDKTSTMTLLKMKDPHIKNAVLKPISLRNKPFTLGAFIDAGKRRMKDEHWFQWDFKHNCFYITRRLLTKNGLYSEDEHEMTRYYKQMQRLYDASKTFSYSKNLEIFVQLQARTVACNLGFVHKMNRILMYSFN